MPNLTFAIISQEGDNYEIGKGRGKLINQIPGLKEFLTSMSVEEAEAERNLDILEKYCPGMKAELQGMADEMGVDVLKLTQLNLGLNETKRGCSQIALMAPLTENGHTYLARSYEYNIDDEMILGATRVPGKYAHVGFSLFQVGRFDGMNEKGLCIAMNSLGVVANSSGQAEGVAFWVAIRSVLDSCADTEQALAKLREIPVADSCAYVIADRSGNCAGVEFIASDGKIFMGVTRSDKYVAEFNHCRNAEMRAKFPRRRRFSTVREEFIEKKLSNCGKLSEKDIYEMLSTPMPDGLCAGDYENWFGTLRSMLFDVTESRLYVCLGTPVTGKWFEADINAPTGVEVVDVECAEVTLPVDYWQDMEG